MSDIEETLSEDEISSARDLQAASFQIARAIWKIETSGMAKEEKQAAWTENRKERMQYARKLARRLGERGVTLNIPAAPDAADDTAE
ncbi:hypothetical protein [Pseudooceanicola nanhaiensis]|uniref:hypothetical protein n=1 Tax=Pseudooceanicola nanhaiensis TaxID=375761 RepID=UPI001CD7A4AE|nr:hypothetical protein [Pseudooceanicola nanhaiensis]MCA0922794.1 hypothetical protein [Pseudooceanicola nanhaiensis]